MTLLRIQDVGHGGNSGQYSYLEDLAYEYSFLITSLGASTQPFYHGIASNFYEAYSVATPLAFSMSRKLASSESESPDQQDQQHSSLKKKRSIRLSNQNLRLRGKEDEEKEYRTKAKKGDRGQNKLFQWLNSFGF